ncbi:hypothetical protein WK81_11065 [Burkholderia ubonensis]|nr:hypothetical protein WK81_11065 [Burkholderia ubonensis]
MDDIQHPNDFPPLTIDQIRDPAAALRGYLQIVDHFIKHEWPRDAFWPHGGHLFCLHVVAALGLGGAEINPFAFRPFRGLADGAMVAAGRASVPQAPGIGFELHRETWETFQAAFGC